MDFKTAVVTCLKKYVDFQGRARRAEFWWFVLFSVLCQIAGQVLGGDILETLVALGLLVPSVAVGVRRMHDIDKSGWWLLLWLLPVVGWIILIYFSAQIGTVGPNRFGPDPITGEDAPKRKPRGGPTEFDRVMDDSYQKSRVPRSGDD